MSYEWDAEKNRLNQFKHGISFDDAKHIFDNAHLTVRDKRKDYSEVRKISIGKILEVLIVVVVHTDRKQNIRIISARRANLKERNRYNDYFKK